MGVKRMSMLRSRFSYANDTNPRFIDGIADLLCESVFMQEEGDFAEVLDLLSEVIPETCNTKLSKHQKRLVKKLCRKASEYQKKTIEVPQTREKIKVRKSGCGSSEDEYQSDEVEEENNNGVDVKESQTESQARTRRRNAADKNEEEEEAGNTNKHYQEKNKQKDNSVAHVKESKRIEVNEIDEDNVEDGNVNQDERIEEEEEIEHSEEEQDNTDEREQELTTDRDVHNKDQHGHEKNDIANQVISKVKNKDQVVLIKKNFNVENHGNYNINNDNNQNVNDHEEVEKYKSLRTNDENDTGNVKDERIGSNRFTICHGVPGISLNMDVNITIGEHENDHNFFGEKKGNAICGVGMLESSEDDTSHLNQKSSPSQYEPSLDSNDVPKVLPQGCLSNKDIISMDNQVKRRVQDKLLKLDLPQSLWLAKDITAFKVRKWLEHMFIPSKHRINNICTFETIRIAHSQLFSMAAEQFFDSSSTNKHLLGEAKEDENVKRIVEAYGMTYFGLKQEEYRKFGWTILKGFCKERDVLSSFGERPNSLSFRTVEKFMEEMPNKDGDSILWERICDSPEDNVVNLAKEGYGRSIMSTYAVMHYMENNGDVWKHRAVLDMCMGMIVAILQAGSVTRGQSSILMPNTGGRGLETYPSASRQSLHCDVEVIEGREKQEPGVSVIISGKDGFPLWIADRSHI